MKNITYFLLTCLLAFSWQGQAQNGGVTCATAVVINPAGQNFTGTTITNTTTGTNNDFAWFSYTATANGTVEVNSCNGGVDSNLFWLSGVCPTPTQIATNDDSCIQGGGSTNNFASRLTNLNVVSGTTYYVQWRDSYASSTNPFNWTLIFTPAPLCPNVTGIVANSFSAGGNATISWTGATGANSYNFEIQPVGIAQGTPGAIVPNTGTISTTNLINGAFVSGNIYTLYVRSVCSGGAGVYQSINFAFNIPPGCATAQFPANGAVGVKSNVTFSWSPPSTGSVPSGYEFFFGTVSGSLTSLGVLTGTAVTLTNLNAGITYFWRIVPQNSGGSATGCPELTFTIQNAPAGPTGITCPSGNNANIFTEAFTTVGGWTGNTGTATANNLWNFGRTGSTPSADTGPTGGQTGAYMYYESSGNAVNTANVVSPPIDLTPVLPTDPTELSFYMHAYGAGIGTLNVGVGSSDAGPFTNVFTFDGQLQVNSAAPFAQVGVNLSAYSGQIIYLQISYTSLASFTGDIAIDTLRVESCANICSAPTALTVNNFTSAPSATISWTAAGSATGYMYEIQNQGVAQGSPNPISSGTTAVNSATASGAFVSGNLYTLYVRTNCSFGNSPYASSNFTFALPPANDACSNAVVVSSLPYTVSQNATFATNNSGFIAVATCGDMNDGVWYSFTGDGSNITIQAAPTSSWDPEIGVYTGACGAFTCVISRDAGGLNVAETATFATVLGTVYYVNIGHWSGTTDSPEGSFNMSITSSLNACGGGNKTWSAGAWTPAGAPTIMDNVIIDGAYNTLTNGNLEACQLTILATRTLTVGADSFVKVQNDIIVGGTLNVIHQGSVVQVNDNAATLKNGVITVRKTTPVLAARAFMIMGSPMSAETRTGVYGSLINVQRNFPANFVPNPAVAAAFPLANNFADDNGDDWQVYTSGLLTSGVGNLVIPQTTAQGSGSASLNYTLGTLNNGLVNVPLQYNGSQNASPNMLGNPYASAIDADLLYSVNSAPSAKFDLVYFWEHLTPPSISYPGYNSANYNMGDISQYNPVSGVGMAAANGGATPTKFIASGQGFAVKALATGTSINFNNSVRVTGNNNTYRRDANTELFYVNIKNDNYALASTTAVHFTENATNGFDAGYDNARMATPVSIYGQMETGEELGMQSRGAFSEDDKISLGFSSQVEASEVYIISLKDLEGQALTNATVFLIDNVNGTVTNLSEGNYSFTSEAGTYPNRFTVQFQNPFLGVDDNTDLAIGLFPNPAKEFVTIASPNALINNVTIFDISGRIIENVRVNSQNTYQLNIASLESAVYFVNVTTENGQVTKRLIKN